MALTPMERKGLWAGEMNQAFPSFQLTVKKPRDLSGLAWAADGAEPWLSLPSEAAWVWGQPAAGRRKSKMKVTCLRIKNPGSSWNQRATV